MAARQWGDGASARRWSGSRAASDTLQQSRSRARRRFDLKRGGRGRVARRRGPKRLDRSSRSGRNHCFQPSGTTARRQLVVEPWASGASAIAVPGCPPSLLDSILEMGDRSIESCSMSVAARNSQMLIPNGVCAGRHHQAEWRRRPPARLVDLTGGRRARCAVCRPHQCAHELGIDHLSRQSSTRPSQRRRLSGARAEAGASSGSDVNEPVRRAPRDRLRDAGRGGAGTHAGSQRGAEEAVEETFLPERERSPCPPRGPRAASEKARRGSAPAGVNLSAFERRLRALSEGFVAANRVAPQGTARDRSHAPGQRSPDSSASATTCPAQSFGDGSCRRSRPAARRRQVSTSRSSPRSSGEIEKNALARGERTGLAASSTSRKPSGGQRRTEPCGRRDERPSAGRVALLRHVRSVQIESQDSPASLARRREAEQDAVGLGSSKSSRTVGLERSPPRARNDGSGDTSLTDSSWSTVAASWRPSSWATRSAGWRSGCSLRGR